MAFNHEHRDLKKLTKKNCNFSLDLTMNNWWCVGFNHETWRYDMIQPKNAGLKLLYYLVLGWTNSYGKPFSTN